MFFLACQSIFLTLVHNLVPFFSTFYFLHNLVPFFSIFHYIGGETLVFLPKGHFSIWCNKMATGVVKDEECQKSYIARYCWRDLGHGKAGIWQAFRFYFCQRISNSPDCTSYCLANSYLEQSIGESGSHGSSRGVPEKYLVVRNDSLIRVKYLLIYADRNLPVSSRLVSQHVCFGAMLERFFFRSARCVAQFQHWFQNNSWTILILFYLLLLLLVGLANSRKLHFIVRRFSDYCFPDYHHPFDQSWFLW